MTDERAQPTRPADGARLRPFAWIGLTLVLFVAAAIASMYVTSLVTSAIGMAVPEREHYALAALVLLGLLMVIIVPAIWRLLGHQIAAWPGLAFALPFLLAAVAGYVIFEDVRSGLTFETDHALPEIFIPPAVILLASAQIGHRLAGDGTARRAWLWVSLAAGVLIAGLIALTGAKMAYEGGDFALDSPMTVLTLVAVGAYVLIAVVPNRFSTVLGR